MPQNANRPRSYFSSRQNDGEVDWIDLNFLPKGHGTRQGNPDTLFSRILLRQQLQGWGINFYQHDGDAAFAGSTVWGSGRTALYQARSFDSALDTDTTARFMVEKGEAGVVIETPFDDSVYRRENIMDLAAALVMLSEGTDVGKALLPRADYAGSQPLTVNGQAADGTVRSFSSLAGSRHDMAGQQLFVTCAKPDAFETRYVAFAAAPAGEQQILDQFFYTPAYQGKMTTETDYIDATVTAFDLEMQEESFERRVGHILASMLMGRQTRLA